MSIPGPVVAAPVSRQWTGVDPTTVPAMFARHAAGAPEALALASGCQSLSYGALERRANRLANYLRSTGVGRDVPVCVCVPRSLGLLIAELAVLKAGGAYVPLDAADPPARLNFIAEDCGARVFLTTAELAGRVQGKGQMIALDWDAERVAHSPDGPPSELPRPEDLAYVVYTSGSTGQPKGVEITHAALNNLVRWHQGEFGIRAEDRAAHLAAVGFDASVWEVWPYLSAGASVHLLGNVNRLEPSLVRDWLIAQGITITFLPTALAERMMAVEWPPRTPLRFLLTGGDTLRSYPPPSLPFAVVNNYGPTECTVVATSGPVLPGTQPAEPPPIGRPIANTEVLLLDEDLRPVPDGQAGEICIGGAGLARGYRNRDGLTAEKFIQWDGRRLFRTGDRGRRLSDGRLAFLGRRDDQVKIRGHRVELNEVAGCLARCPGIRQSAVDARRDASGELQLVAYVIPEPGARLTAGPVRQFLREHLPQYMVPCVCVELEALPVTARGKIDRGALPDPDGARKLPESPGAPVSGAIEARVAALVCQLLQVGSVGPQDNFFLLGGHSLLAAQLSIRLRETFGVEVPLKDLFERPSVADLAAEVQRLMEKA